MNIIVSETRMPPRRPKKPPDGAPPPVDAPQIAPECTPSPSAEEAIATKTPKTRAPRPKKPTDPLQPKEAASSKLPKARAPRRKKPPPDTLLPPQLPEEAATATSKKSTRTYKRRDGELLSKELQNLVIAHPDNTMKKGAVRKLSKMELCDVSRGLNIIDDRQFNASLARRSEGRKCYLWTLIRERKLHSHVDDYVRWWSVVWTRGTLIANGFASADLIGIDDLLSITFLKKLMYPDRYAIAELPPGLHDWLNTPGRRQAFMDMRPASTTMFSGTIQDQAVTYMARRYRGNIKGHILTHLHRRVFEVFHRRHYPMVKYAEPSIPVKRALIEGVYRRVNDPQDAWRICKFREWLGVDPEEVVGRSISSADPEDEAMAAAEGDAEDEGDAEQAPIDSPFRTAWAVHSRLCDLGITTMLPISSLSRHNALIDGRIMSCLVRRFNLTANPMQRLRVVNEDEVLRRYCLPRRRHIVRRKRGRRKFHRGSRKQYRR